MPAEESMHLVAIVFSFAFGLQPVVVAQEPEWKPHFTAQFGLSNGHIESTNWYRIQDRRTEVKQARSFSADITAKRWSVFANTTRVPHRKDVLGSTIGFHMTAASYRGVSLGFGGRYWISKNATAVFTSGDTIIASASERALAAASLDGMVGHYNRTYLRIQALYGNARLTDSLDLLADGRVANSTLALHHFSHSDFAGLGVTAVVKYRFFAPQATASCFVPIQRSDALPSRECILTGGSSLYLPTRLKLGSNTGLFVRGTRVFNRRRPDQQSVQFLDNGLTFGITVRVP